jgi:hypothetical protein
MVADANLKDGMRAVEFSWPSDEVQEIRKADLQEHRRVFWTNKYKADNRR